MKKNLNYFVERNKETNEIVYIEYEKIDGYKVTPKTVKEDAIEVSKIVFVNPTLTEKLVKKKIEIKMQKLIDFLSDEGDEGGEDAVRKSLMEAERIKLNIINKYLKYLGHEYANLSLKKIQLIINELRYKLISYREIEQSKLFNSEVGRRR